MLRLIRAPLRRTLGASVARTAARDLPRAFEQRRFYAKKDKGVVKDAHKLVPGSKQPLTDPAAREEYTKCEDKMSAAAEWFRKDCAEGATRATGRITPALLDSVKVDGQPLQSYATVGVRDGSVLVVTVFEDSTMKSVEGAIYDAKLTGMTPQRVDNRTLRIPVPKPTVDAKTQMAANASRKAEEARVQCRKFHQASLKKGKYEKRSIELETFQKLLDKYIADVDKILSDMKKALGVGK